MSASQMITFCIEFMRKDSMVLKGDIDRLENTVSKIKTQRGMEDWLMSAKTLMRMKKYGIMKEEFLDKFRPDLGFLSVSDDDISLIENIIKY